MFYLILVYLFIAFILWYIDRKQTYMNKFIHLIFMLLWGVVMPIVIIIYFYDLLMDKLNRHNKW